MKEINIRKTKCVKHGDIIFSKETYITHSGETIVDKDASLTIKGVFIESQQGPKKIKGFTFNEISGFWGPANFYLK